MSEQPQKDLDISVSDEIHISESLTVATESDHLIISNKKKVRELISNPALSEEDIIDALIAIHIVLEVGLNTLFRRLSLENIKKDIDRFEIVKNIDEINFIDKTVLFIYNSKFNFNEKLIEASQYHGVIGTLKNFAGVRNKLLHGHSISSIFSNGETKHSALKKNINREFLIDQIERFKFVLEGMRFYLDCLDSSYTENGKEALKNEYLNDDFLNL